MSDTKDILRRCYKKFFITVIGVSMMIASTCGCTKKQDDSSIHTDTLTKREKDDENDNTILSDQEKADEHEVEESNLEQKEIEKYFEHITYTEAGKSVINNNPLMAQRYGADPYVIEYDGRVYVYMTADTPEYDKDGKILTNTYGNINKLNVISSADLVNWTDHGSILAAGKDGTSKWGNNSWAPAACCKEIDGKMKFFIYFANGGNGIGVVTSDSPTGPFVDPLGHALISRKTTNCANVAWLFDPAVLIDDDGRAYLYFGGGVPDGKFANPGTGRAVELGDDMISIKGDPTSWEIPYLFEDSGINKFGDTYYYSYCSNFNVDAEGAKKLGIENGEIVYMTSKNPLGPFKFEKSILHNPAFYFGNGGNNHHCMFTFKGKTYIAYHSQILQDHMKLSGGYRSTNIDEVKIDDNGEIQMIMGTEKGVDQVGTLNPFVLNEAETMATMAGINTVPCSKESQACGSGNMAVTEIHTGDWIALKGVDFGSTGASKFSATVKLPKESVGAIQIKLDRLSGETVGYVELGTSDQDEFTTVSTQLLAKVTGKHDLYYVFYGEGYEWDNWIFE